MKNLNYSHHGTLADQQLQTMSKEALIDYVHMLEETVEKVCEDGEELFAKALRCESLDHKGLKAVNADYAITMNDLIRVLDQSTDAVSNFLDMSYIEWLRLDIFEKRKAIRNRTRKDNDFAYKVLGIVNPILIPEDVETDVAEYLEDLFGFRVKAWEEIQQDSQTSGDEY